MIYGYTSMIHNRNYSKFDFQKCLMFGSLISATDPGNEIEFTSLEHRFQIFNKLCVKFYDLFL